jgi:hypothetical protein
MDDHPEVSEAARRGLQRAAVHMMRAVIEIVEGVGAFLEEMGKIGDAGSDPGDAPEGRQHIPVD